MSQFEWKKFTVVVCAGVTGYQDLGNWLHRPKIAQGTLYNVGVTGYQNLGNQLYRPKITLGTLYNVGITSYQDLGNRYTDKKMDFLLCCTFSFEALSGKPQFFPRCEQHALSLCKMHQVMNVNEIMVMK